MSDVSNFRIFFNLFLFFMIACHQNLNFCCIFDSFP